MLKIGITGGIGSGKTTVCKLFQFFGIPVYFADDRAKQLMVSDKHLIKKIKKIFGNESYFENGNLNRKYISSIAFNDESKLKKLNNSVHPAVKKDFEKWTKEQKSSILIKEAALLFETGSYKDLDFNILVSAPVEMRIKRVMSRDNIDRESILSRIKNQMPEEEKIKLADFIINNDGEHSLIHQILELNKKFKEINAKIR